MAAKHLVWLVTGCSSGFGEAFVKEILQRGDKAIATARDINTIQHLARLGATTLQLDVTSSTGDLKEVVEAAVNVHGRVDVLVNNAGSLQLGAAEDLTSELLYSQFQLNVFGTLNVTRAVLPHMRQQRSGHIVLVGSAAHWTGGLGLGAHAATKAAIEAFFENLANEIKPAGIKTLILEPGSFRTNIAHPDKYNFPPSEYHKEIMAWMEDHLKELHGTQKNDPAKFAKVAMDLVKGEGFAAGKEVPLRMVIGHNMCDLRRPWLKKEMEILDEWEPLITSTGYD